MCSVSAQEHFVLLYTHWTEESVTQSPVNSTFAMKLSIFVVFLLSIAFTGSVNALYEGCSNSICTENNSLCLTVW